MGVLFVVPEVEWWLTPFFWVKRGCARNTVANNRGIMRDIQGALAFGLRYPFGTDCEVLADAACLLLLSRVLVPLTICRFR